MCVYVYTQRAWPHPWGLVNFSLLETSATPRQMEGKCVKGKKRSIYLVQEGKLREFQNIDAFERRRVAV